MKKILQLGCTAVLLLCMARLCAQMPLIDRGIFIEGLWCYPMHNDSLNFVYLPNNARFALNEEAGPRFSYLRYAINKPKEGNTTASVTEADGGGILHLMVLYETTPESVSNAQSALQKQLRNDKIRLTGPVTFEKGTYALVSSVIREGSKNKEIQLIATGDAPVIENTSLALSFSLDPVHSKLLLESLKMKTPDVSVVFDLSFTGLTESYDAEMEVDWSEVKKSQTFKAGGSIYFVGADVELGFDKLRRENAIKLKVNGSNTALEQLLNTVYDRLLSLMFQPVQSEQVADPGGMGDALGAIIGGAMSSRSTTGFGINVGYQLKEMQSEGVSRLFFKGRSTIKRHHYITFNVSDVYQKYGQNNRYFKDVPLWDPLFQQREVFIGVDGDLEKEFGKILNSVTVNIRKKHLSGQVTTDSKLITAQSFNQAFKPLSVVYGWSGDTLRTDWMEYEYMNIWQFQGGGTYQTNWEKTAAAMVNAYTPFVRRNIIFDGDLAGLKDKGIKAVSVVVSYPFFGKTNKPRITLRPSDNISEKSIEITLPKEIEAVDYEITWQKSDGTLVTQKGQDRFGLIFIDEIPTK